jgi:hypothetical protein
MPGSLVRKPREPLTVRRLGSHGHALTGRWWRALVPGHAAGILGHAPAVTWWQALTLRPALVLRHALVLGRAGGL